MSGIFIELLNMSIYAGFAVVIVFVIRLLIIKTPKKYSYALWVVVFLRFIVPFTIQLPVSSDQALPQTVQNAITFSERLSVQSVVPGFDNADNSATDGIIHINQTSSTNSTQIALRIGLIVWLAGIIALVLYTAISYKQLHQKVRTAIHVNDNIYETDLITTPFVFGFLRPKIYVPIGFNTQESQYVIQHEQTHIIRRDYLIKPLAFFVTIFHWFNPMAWVAYVLMARDMELSADESVLKKSATDIRSMYSNSLLTMSAQKNAPLSQLAFIKIGIKSRIRNVLKYRKPTLFINTVTSVLVLAASVLLLAVSPSNTSSINSLTTSSSLVVYIEEFISENEIIELQNRIETIPNVKSSTFISRHDALDEFKQLVEDSPHFEEIDESYFRDRYLVYMANPAERQQTVNNLARVHGVNRVIFDNN